MKIRNTFTKNDLTFLIKRPRKSMSSTDTKNDNLGLLCIMYEV